MHEVTLGAVSGGQEVEPPAAVAQSVPTSQRLASSDTQPGWGSSTSTAAATGASSLVRAGAVRLATLARARRSRQLGLTFFEPRMPETFSAHWMHTGRALAPLV